MIDGVVTRGINVDAVVVVRYVILINTAVLTAVKIYSRRLIVCILYREPGYVHVIRSYIEDVVV